MAMKSYLALPPVVAVFGWLFLLLPTGLFAQVTPGSLADCVDLVAIEFSSYMAVEETYVDSGCVRRQGDAYIFRSGLSGADEVEFYAFAEMRQCWVQDEVSVVGTIFGLSGGDVAAWKKYLLNEGCDMVTYVAPVKRIVFVTSQTFTGNLIQGAKNLGIKGRINSGLEAADKICTKLANDAGLPGGTYTAWLSDATMNASDRVVHSEVPYVLVTNTQVAGDFDSLIDVSSYNSCVDGKCLDNAIDRDQAGALIFSELVWTGTSRSGTKLEISADSDDWCQNYTATTGKAWVGATYFRQQQWTEHANYSCSNAYHLYCFQD